MNEDDKKRFARYKKGYIQNPNEFDDDKINDNKKKLGHIDKININVEEFVKDLIKK